MPDGLVAFVVSESGSDFTCEIANLTERSLFLRTDTRLRFRDKVSVTFFSVELEGEVVLATEDPVGLMVTFDADDEIRQRIAAHMDVAEIIEPPPVLWSEQVPEGPIPLPETKPLGVRPLEESGTEPGELYDGEEPTALEMEAITFNDDTGQQLRSGLTSHAAPRPATASNTITSPVEARQLRPNRKAQESKVDNPTPPASTSRRPKGTSRDQQITDLDPNVLLDNPPPR